MKKAILLILLLPAFLQAAESYTFGIIPYDTPLSSINNQNRLIRYLEQKSGLTFKRLQLNNDEEMIKAYRAGIVDVAWIGSYQYMKYGPQLYSYPIVKPVRYGRSFYRAAFIAHESSEIQSIDMLRGRTIAFVSRKSEAGYIYPTVMLSQRSMYEGNQYFAQFLKGHDNVLYEVYDKKYDAGCVFDSSIDVFLNAKQRSAIRVIGYSEEIPYEPIIVSKRMTGSDAKLIQEVLSECNDATLLDSLSIERFTEASQREYSVYPSRSFMVLDFKSEE